MISSCGCGARAGKRRKKEEDGIKREHKGTRPTKVDVISKKGGEIMEVRLRGGGGKISARQRREGEEGRKRTKSCCGLIL